MADTRGGREAKALVSARVEGGVALLALTASAGIAACNADRPQRFTGG